MRDVAQGRLPVGHQVLDPAEDRLDALGLQLTDGPVEVLVAEVDADRAGHVRELGVVVDPLIELVALASRLLLGGADDEVQPLEELEVVRRAPVRDGARPDVGGVPGRGLDVGRHDEDRLGVLRGEGAARLGGAGLEEQRRALRRRADQVRALHPVARADVIDPVDLVVVRVHPGFPVLEQRVFLP
nr:hypothetical protein GCM10020092_037410 [Actinoplanes digitatis]